MVTCPCCGSRDIDMEHRRCNACTTYLPDGSFDVRPRYRFGKAGMRAYTTAKAGVESKRRTRSITGGRA